MEKITCPACRTEIDDSNNFCPNCQSDLNKPGKMNNVTKIPGYILLLVIVITLVVFLILPMKDKAEADLIQCQCNLNNIATALQIYAADHDGEYPLMLEDLKPKYLKRIPQCAASKIQTYTDGYQYYNNSENINSNRFTVFCAGHAHQTLAVPENHPVFSLSEGLSIVSKKRGKH